MNEWMDGVARALGRPALTDDEMELLLTLARDVSHASGDRRTAPLTTFLAGEMVASTAAGSRRDAIDRARRLVDGVSGSGGAAATSDPA